MQESDLIRADLALSSHQNAVVSMMDAYAADPMGDGKHLSADVRANLIPGLRAHPTTVIFLAFDQDRPVGIAVCFRGFSTFAAKPLMHVSDFFVKAEMRGRGVGRLLLEKVQLEASSTDCCKITLEVQENNAKARKIYTAFGFSRAVYVEEAGGSLCMSKSLSKGPR